MREFRTESIPVHLTLVRAIDSLHLEGGALTCGWEIVAEQGVDVLWAPGDHETMFRGNNLRVTANLVSESLAAVESAASGERMGTTRLRRNDVLQRSGRPASI